VSAPQHHSLYTRRSPIAQSPARPHPSRDTAHRRENILSAREPNPPAPRRADASRLSSLRHPESPSAVASRRGHSPELRWRSLRPRGRALSAGSATENSGRAIVTIHQTRQARQRKKDELRPWRLGGSLSSRSPFDAEGFDDERCAP
jgi:hypothetical protein